MDNDQTQLIRTSFEIARSARAKGNHPFGALLADPAGRILLEAENTMNTDHDLTGHAEMNLIRAASARFDQAFLKECTLYTSTEPCPMCAGAIFWAGVGTVVYGLSEEGLYDITGTESGEVLLLHCRDVFAKGLKPIKVTGPILEEEARQVHIGFWDKSHG